MTQQNEMLHRLVAESCVEAVRRAVRELRTQELREERMRTNQKEVLQLTYWKEPLSQTAAWLYDRTLAPAIEHSPAAFQETRASYAKTVGTHYDDDAASESDASRQPHRRHRRVFDHSIATNNTIPVLHEYELQVTGESDSKVVDNLLESWTKLSKDQLTQDKQTIGKRQAEPYQADLKQLIRACVNERAVEDSSLVCMVLTEQFMLMI